MEALRCPKCIFCFQRLKKTNTFEPSYDAKNLYIMIKASNTENLKHPGHLLWESLARTLFWCVFSFFRHISNETRRPIFRLMNFTLTISRKSFFQKKINIICVNCLWSWSYFFRKMTIKWRYDLHYLEKKLKISIDSKMWKNAKF